MPDLKVAAVIVSYRTAALTIESLRSLQMERSTPGLDIRAVVIDNASGDHAQIRRAVDENGWGGWVTLVQSDINGGFAYGNNLGVRHACADGAPSYFYLLNPDTQVRPGAILPLVQFLESHAAAGIAGSSFENIDGSDWPVAFRFPGLTSELSEGTSLRLISALFPDAAVARTMGRDNEPVDWICGASMMIRPQVFDAIGGLDENYFLYFEETDFCRRAKLAGFSTWYIPQSRVMHIAGQSTNLTGFLAKIPRLPAYWFDSRRRYFATAFGIRRAILIDVVAFLAYSLGYLKKLVQRNSSAAVPHFVRDLIRHSVIWPGNRDIPPVRCDALRGKQPLRSG
jgi:N-acetylglucosaminyl-diphospho-decaprenol L-rhamnosyltransferase